MRRGWMSVALVAACWCLNVPAQAQFSTYPSPVGAARMPEPIPCGPSAGGPPPAPLPNLVPGPISPQAAPMGPPDCINSLPADHVGAFQCENYVEDCGFFLNFGPMALERNKMGAGDIAVFNAQAEGQPFGPVIPNPFLPAPAGTASALSFNSVSPALALGFRGTVGYQWGNQGIELTTFYIWEDDATAAIRAPGQLDTLFFNPPITFAGDSLFRRADQVSETIGSSLFSTELNYRRWDMAVHGLELIAGVRFVRQNDLLNITTQGEALVVPSLGMGLPSLDMATYSVICHNNITAPQLGGEYTVPICSWLGLTGLAKGAWGVNYLTTDVSLTRGDGLTGFDTHRNATVFSQIYEIGAFADIAILQKLRLRLGYTNTWITGVATSNDQVDINLGGSQAISRFGGAGFNQIIQSGGLNQLINVQQQMPHGRVNNNGSLMYFGPQIELQFFF